MTTKPTTWILEVQEDPETGDLFIEFPPDFLAAQGWKTGDTLTWGIDKENGDVSLTKKAE